MNLRWICNEGGFVTGWLHIIRMVDLLVRCLDVIFRRVIWKVDLRANDLFAPSVLI